MTVTVVPKNGVPPGEARVVAVANYSATKEGDWHGTLILRCNDTFKQEAGTLQVIVSL